MPVAGLDQLPAFTRSTLPDASANTILRDVMVVIEENDGTRGVWISNGRAWVGVGSAGAVSFVDVTASRDWSATTDKNKVLRPSPAGSSFTVTIKSTGGQVAGDVFATEATGAGKVTIAIDGSMTSLNDTGALQAAQVAHDFPLGFLFETALIVDVG